ncbi:tRNA uridine-5-carboxymethylaminomethyl(34) synthesis GTPase MnmE [Alicyclobacillus mengziensis]|uniref:tRNA modification GTPase MnmE n=2 Tax=Alicyclobacillus mengziensis TaxID=2931921 RepID=A0A9X7W3A2_9BACL|nr:tRNA uridine-5-carboxymethylaminomethyl(34) synthesis GTPase MnmE [Alicyclobacillus mengziensis]
MSHEGIPMESDTIAAIGTALGEASVGMVRVSGPNAGDIGNRMLRLRKGPKLSARKRGMWYGTVIDPESGDEIDECLALWMPGPNSYTAEDVLEFQVHGGLQLVQGVLRATMAAGARLAEPGEFTKRAFLNGRIDLSQAEAVMDLIRSKTELASRSALQLVKGQFSDKVRRLRKRLIRLQAHVEVTIDYPEHDVESVAAAAVIQTGKELLTEIQELLRRGKMGQVLREGIRTVIAGRPNVGKSSLMNALLRRDRAIVTEIPGTTRDVLEEYANIGGIPFRIADTAGIRETEDIVERLGVERSREALREAEFIVVMLNRNEPLAADDERLLALTTNIPRVIAVNKIDLSMQLDEERLQMLAGNTPIVELSLKGGLGLRELETEMVKQVSSGGVRADDVSYMTNARQNSLLEAVIIDLEGAVEAAQNGATLDVIAVQLQSAYAGLGLVIGEEAGEDLLNEIFSNFCLGK